MTSGKLTDIIINDVVTRNHWTGLETVSQFNVYADSDLLDVIERVEGAMIVHKLAETLYRVVLDPRYDPAWVKAEIIAAIKCRGT